MDISIVTITFNNYDELLKTLQSIEGLDCERIVINGGGCKKTREFLNSNTEIVSISEPDKGIADAFNKGIKLSTRQGIWILNSGDVCINREFVKFASQEINNLDFIYADVTFNSPIYGQQILKPTPYKPLGLRMPYPHPGMILNRKTYDKIGLFNSNYKIAMDFELICRMQKANSNGKYFPHSVTLMDGAGISNTQLLKAHYENGNALRENNLMTPSNYFFYKKRELKLFAREIVRNLGLLGYYHNIKKILLR